MTQAQRYRLANRDRIKIRQHRYWMRYREANREKILACRRRHRDVKNARRRRLYRENREFREKANAGTRLWRLANPEKVDRWQQATRQKTLMRKRNQRKLLSDWYINQLLCSPGGGMKAAFANPEIIKVKRELVRIHRAIKSLTH